MSVHRPQRNSQYLQLCTPLMDSSPEILCLPPHEPYICNCGECLATPNKAIMWLTFLLSRLVKQVSYGHSVSSKLNSNENNYVFWYLIHNSTHKKLSLTLCVYLLLIKGKGEGDACVLVKKKQLL